MAYLSDIFLDSLGCIYSLECNLYRTFMPLFYRHMVVAMTKMTPEPTIEKSILARRRHSFPYDASLEAAYQNGINQSLEAVAEWKAAQHD